MKGNLGAERAVLAGVCQYGREAFYDIADIVTANTFSIQENQAAWKCVEQILVQSEKVDATSILAQAETNGLSIFFKKKEDVEFLRSLFITPIRLENVRQFAKQIAKLEIIQKEQNALLAAHHELENFDGTESIDKIIGAAEQPIFDVTQHLNGQNDTQPKLIGEGAEERLTALFDNPVEMIGIPTPYPIYNSLIGGGIRNGVTLIGARPKIGKAQPLNAVIMTPNGPIQMKDVKVGSRILHPSGSSTKVIAIHPQGKQQLYIVKFNDGTETECCEDHLWEVQAYRFRTKQIISTKELKQKLNYMDGRPRWMAAPSLPVEMNTQNVPLDPYFLGLLLGDGGITECVSFTTADTEILNYVEGVIDDNYSVKPQGKYGYRITKQIHKNLPNKYVQILKDLNLYGLKSDNKFIPPIYKYNDIQTRLSLLQGLLDTDGHAATHCIEYTSKSQQLCLDVKELAESLGCLCTMKGRYTSCNNKKFFSYRLHIKSNNSKLFFKLSRKIADGACRKKRPIQRKIIDIIQTNQFVDMQCITVENPDGMYLTNNYIPTHNSNFAINTGLHVVDKLKIPVLYIDTEMAPEEQQNRIIACLSEIDNQLIETGKAGKIPYLRQKALESTRYLKKLAFHHKWVGGMPFEEIMSIIRRWLYSVVGFDDNGKTKPHLIIYDYFKLMDSETLEKMAEHQAIGFQISALSDFCKRYQSPCLAFVQLNRDGITKDSGDVLAQSDRLLWLCTSAAIFKRKDKEEMVEDGWHNGNRKLILLEGRFGEPLEEGDYVSMNLDGAKSKITEIGLKSKLAQQEQTRNSGFEISDDSNEETLEL